MVWVEVKGKEGTLERQLALFLVLRPHDPVNSSVTKGILSSLMASRRDLEEREEKLREEEERRVEAIRRERANETYTRPLGKMVEEPGYTTYTVDGRGHVSGTYLSYTFHGGSVYNSTSTVFMGGNTTGFFVPGRVDNAYL